VTVQAVGPNPTRPGLVDALSAMGADVAIGRLREVSGEPVADVRMRASALCAIAIAEEEVVRMIDEMPIFAVLATQAEGVTTVRDAAELRVKESDRIAALACELRKLGARIEEYADGFAIEGPAPLRGAVVDAHGDHRLALALAVAGLIATGETTVIHAEIYRESFPDFVELMRGLGGRIA
jgi:3-phosphoshikimate 1-carboxyvinyltransferase